MKLIVIIPAYNEEKTLPLVLKEIPRQINGLDQLKVVVIDDGSADGTKEAALKSGADYVFSNKVNLGLAQSFSRGLQEALKLGADIIVNTDADFQYNQTEIPKLIQPILEDRADIVVGDRQIKKLTHMNWKHKYGNLIGNYLVGKILQIKVDVSSGFRAFNREAALKFIIFSKHTYTHEVLIQAKAKNLRVVGVPVEFRKRPGNSRLIKNVFTHISKSLMTIFRTIITLWPLRFFTYSGLLILLAGMILDLRYLFLFWLYQATGHIQSLLLGAILVIVGILVMIMGWLADLINRNRMISEEILYFLRKRKYEEESKK